MNDIIELKPWRTSCWNWFWLVSRVSRKHLTAAVWGARLQLSCSSNQLIAKYLIYSFTRTWLAFFGGRGGFGSSVGSLDCVNTLRRVYNIVTSTIGAEGPAVLHKHKSFPCLFLVANISMYICLCACIRYSLLIAPYTRCTPNFFPPNERL